MDLRVERRGRLGFPPRIPTLSGWEHLLTRRLDWAFGSGSGHERQRQAPACWPATLQSRWGAPGDDRAWHRPVCGQARTPPGVLTGSRRCVVSSTLELPVLTGVDPTGLAVLTSPDGDQPGLCRHRAVPAGCGRDGGAVAAELRQRAPGSGGGLPAVHGGVPAGPAADRQVPWLPPGRPGGVHPSHHRRDEPAGAGGAARHSGGHLRQ